MAARLEATLKLNTGAEIPLLGLGVFRAQSGSETQEAVRTALEIGYRHIDTAAIYGNESDVGKAVRSSGLPREQVFVTTKLWNSDHGYEQALRACSASLKRLGMDYVDLYLIHWPVPELRLESWRALTKLHQEGYCRAIGVSNYMVRHLQELLDASETVPAVNQIECHPFLTQVENRAFCQEKGIVVEAYSPLTKGMRLDHPVIQQIAHQHGRSPAQILLRWGIQNGMVILPKSTNADRIRQNAELADFELSPETMQVLNGLNENLYTGWNPSDAP